MASKPGFLTDWPWKSLGTFKYAILGPWVGHSMYLLAMMMISKGEEARRAVDLGNMLVFPFMLLRLLHNQIWISLSRYQTAKGNKRILDKGFDFDQVDRESNWDDQIIMTALMQYMAIAGLIPGASNLPIWRSDGIILLILLHAGPVEFLYYWLHRALHHHFLYSRYHSHHHSSIVTQPISSVIHPFAETMAYFALFFIPKVTLLLSGTGSLAAVFGYVFYIDLMNNMGHCNFEFISAWLFSVFPPLKYLMYTPSFHSLHHTQFRTNYSLFMPMYDYLYKTVDKSSDDLHQASLRKPAEWADVVYLTHMTTPESIYHLPFGFASLASMPLKTSSITSTLVRPLTLFLRITLANWILGGPHHFFVADRNIVRKLKSQTWVIPTCRNQYLLRGQAAAINTCIEEAVLEAERRGTKVISLGLLNQGEELNRYGKLYIDKYPWLKVKVVDGSSLAAAVVVNSIPEGTTQILLRPNQLTKVAHAIASALCQRGIQVAVGCEDDHKQLKLHLAAVGSQTNNLVLTKSYHDQKIWLIGEELSEKEESEAPKGTLFIPIMQFHPEKSSKGSWMRKDCIYHTTPAMMAPKTLENMHCCEEWLPRRAMSAWRVAGIVHALEGWKGHECGDTLFDIQKVWDATLKHGFRPLPLPPWSLQKLK